MTGSVGKYLDPKYCSVKSFIFHSEGDSPGRSGGGEEGQAGDEESDERAGSR